MYYNAGWLVWLTSIHLTLAYVDANTDMYVEFINVRKLSSNLTKHLSFFSTPESGHMTFSMSSRLTIQSIM